MKQVKFLSLCVLSLFLFSCSSDEANNENGNLADSSATSEFSFFSDQFADLRILRYKVDGFEQLTPKQKELAYYLYEAARAGNDIIWDQNYKYNLTVRKTLEAIVSSYNGDQNTEEWKQFMTYAKRVWFSNGIHHHYSSIKFLPDCSDAYFASLVENSDKSKLPLSEGEDVSGFIQRISPIIFDMSVASKKVNLNANVDLLTNSATNFYEGVTEDEATTFYNSMKNAKDTTPPSYGLNSKLKKDGENIVEQVWKVGGMYSAAIEKIVYWLEKAVGVAENDNQKKALELLIQYYKSGDLKAFDEYCIAWVNDTNSVLDVVNGFIEVYGDPMGRKGSFESVLSLKDFEASKRIATIGAEAQWFEDYSPLMEEHKKKDVKGISAKVITVIVESGDAAPSTPIGINLPNANWIRQNHGSKSVALGNIVYAYEKAKSPDLVNEFFIDSGMNERVKQHGALAGALHTDMHEVIGHASGQLNPGVGQPHETLKNYANALEEGRADLVALYYILDQKLIDIGVMPTIDVGKAEYDNYITNGLMIQLARLKPGEQIEQSHMRNRAMVARWALEKGAPDNVIETKNTSDGRTYYVINDYNKLRSLFGELLREVQRIKSEGDYEAGKALIENYGVKVDPDFHKQILERYAQTGIAPYAGFIQPRLVPVLDGDKITDVKVEYPDDFVKQMLEYGEKYAHLPVVN